MLVIIASLEEVKKKNFVDNFTQIMLIL